MKLFVISLIATLFPLLLCGQCPHNINARIQECVQPVAEYAKILNKQDDRQQNNNDFGTSAFQLPNMGGRVFNELCKLIAKFNVCIREYRSKCSRHVTVALIDSSYGYLCNEGYNTFMESAECLMELDRKPSVKKCHDETLREIESANTETGIAMAAKLDRMCGALNFFSGCVRSPIKDECGFSAWQVIYRVLRDTTNTLMPACQFTGSSSKLPPPPESFEERNLIENENEYHLIRPTTMSETEADESRREMRKNIQAQLMETVSNDSTNIKFLPVNFLLLYIFYALCRHIFC